VAHRLSYGGGAARVGAEREKWEIHHGKRMMFEMESE
jgi:hypothetical protein